MSIEYTIIPGNGGGPDGRGAWMTHEAPRLRYEMNCDGCGQPFGNQRIVVVITDRSGSEYAASHAECVVATVATLAGEDPELVIARRC